MSETPMIDKMLSNYKELTRPIYEEFVNNLKTSKMEIINLNIKRNVNGQTHEDFNFVFDKIIKKYEKMIK